MKVIQAWNDMRLIKRSLIFGIKYCFKGYIKSFDNLSILAESLHLRRSVHSFSVPEQNEQNHDIPYLYAFTQEES